MRPLLGHPSPVRQKPGKGVCQHSAAASLTEQVPTGVVPGLILRLVSLGQCLRPFQPHFLIHTMPGSPWGTSGTQGQNTMETTVKTVENQSKAGRPNYTYTLSRCCLNPSLLKGLTPNHLSGSFLHHQKLSSGLTVSHYLSLALLLRPAAWVLAPKWPWTPQAPRWRSQAQTRSAEYLVPLLLHH